MTAFPATPRPWWELVQSRLERIAHIFPATHRIRVRPGVGPDTAAIMIRLVFEPVPAKLDGQEGHLHVCTVTRIPALPPPEGGGISICSHVRECVRTNTKSGLFFIPRQGTARPVDTKARGMEIPAAPV